METTVRARSEPHGTEHGTRALKCRVGEREEHTQSVCVLTCLALVHNFRYSVGCLGWLNTAFAHGYVLCQ